MSVPPLSGRAAKVVLAVSVAAIVYVVVIGAAVVVILARAL